MTDITAQPGIMEIDLYVGGKATLDGHENVLKLSSNENPLGPPPAAQTAIVQAASGTHLYPSTDHAELRAAIAEVHGLEAGRIICGVGSDEVLQFVCQAFSGPGDEIIHTEHGFSMYPILAHMAGATPVCVPERDRVVDIDAILSAVTDKTRIVLLTNPGNPTSTVLPDSEVTRLADGLPEGVILVIDAAYLEYTDGIDGGLTLARNRPNVIMTRTFSKIYGLAGQRIGWATGAPGLIDVLNRIRGPFNVTTSGQKAALAALGDQDFVVASRTHNAAERARFVAAIEALGNHGLVAVPSEANFVLVEFNGELSAETALGAIAEAGYAVRHLPGQGLPNALRITIGKSADMDKVIACLRSLCGESA